MIFVDHVVRNFVNMNMYMYMYQYEPNSTTCLVERIDLGKK